MAMAWLVDEIFIQFYLGFESILIGDENTISEFRGILVLNYFEG